MRYLLFPLLVLGLQYTGTLLISSWWSLSSFMGNVRVVDGLVAPNSPKMQFVKGKGKVPRGASVHSNTFYIHTVANLQ